jgi:hypothetical protein
MGDVSGDWSPGMMRDNAAKRSPFVWDAVQVSAPDTKAVSGKVVTIPVRLDNLMGEPVSSYQFMLEYDPSVIHPAQIAADLSATMSDGMSLAYHLSEPGVVKVVVYSAFPVTGEGVYVNLNFIATGKPGTSSPLVISGFRLNDGESSVAAIEGRLTVSGP